MCQADLNCPVQSLSQFLHIDLRLKDKFSGLHKGVEIRRYAIGRRIELLYRKRLAAFQSDFLTTYYFYCVKTIF